MRKASEGKLRNMRPMYFNIANSAVCNSVSRATVSTSSNIAGYG